jgi:hypothetical protein
MRQGHSTTGTGLPSTRRSTGTCKRIPIHFSTVFVYQYRNILYTVYLFRRTESPTRKTSSVVANRALHQPLISEIRMFQLYIVFFP